MSYRYDNFPSGDYDQWKTRSDMDEFPNLDFPEQEEIPEDKVMNDNDTSDEAYLQWIRGKEEVYPRDAWREAVRRCEARMEERERQAIAFAIGCVLYADGIAPQLEIEEVYQAFKGR